MNEKLERRYSVVVENDDGEFVERDLNLMDTLKSADFDDDEIEAIATLAKGDETLTFCSMVRRLQ